MYQEHLLNKQSMNFMRILLILKQQRALLRQNRYLTEVNKWILLSI